MPVSFPPDTQRHRYALHPASPREPTAAAPSSTSTPPPPPSARPGAYSVPRPAPLLPPQPSHFPDEPSPLRQGNLIRTRAFPSPDPLDPPHVAKTPASTVALASMAQSTSSLACRARRLLPPRLVQMEAILDLYWSRISVAMPFYDPGLMLQRTRDIYLLPLSKAPVSAGNLTGMTLPMLAWLCAACSAVFRLAQPTRLLIWGVVDDASSVARKAYELNVQARECLRMASVMGEKALCPMRGCPAALLRIQAGVAIVSSASCGAPPPGCSEVLDVSIRAARQAGLDRMGKISQRPRTLHEFEKTACWLALVCADWRAAPYLGCYTIYPQTFSTEWDLSMEELIESHIELSRAQAHARSSKRPSLGSMTRSQSPDGDGRQHEVEDEDADDGNLDTDTVGPVDDHAAYWVWSWQIRLADEARKLCDLGVHDAAQRVNVGYEKVADHDRSLQDLLASRPPELLAGEVKKENRDPRVHAKLKRHPWLLMQAAAVTIPLRTILLSLHMPYVLSGYQDAMANLDSGQSHSIASALEQSVHIVRAAQRASMKGIILHRQWSLRHSLFNAGLLLIFDLLLRNSSLLPPVYPGGAFGEHSLDEEVALAIECLDDSSWRRGRAEVTDVPWVNNSDFPQWVSIAPGSNAPPLGVQHFTGERLERLLVLALKRNGQQGDGAMAVDTYMQAYTTNMIGHRRSLRQGAPNDILPPALRSARSRSLLHSHLEAGKSIKAEPEVPQDTPQNQKAPAGPSLPPSAPSDPTPLSVPISTPALDPFRQPASAAATADGNASANELPCELWDPTGLAHLLQFADLSTGIPVDQILSDPFLLNLTNPAYPHAEYPYA